MSHNGVKLALDAARERVPEVSPYTLIAQVLTLEEGAQPISENAIYNFEHKGFFPPARAKVIAKHFGLSYRHLVSDRVRATLDADDA